MFIVPVRPEGNRTSTDMITGGTLVDLQPPEMQRELLVEIETAAIDLDALHHGPQRLLTERAGLQHPEPMTVNQARMEQTRRR